MDTINIVLCGFGGQGILFMTKVLAQTALNKGHHVMGAETHGMAQRGGSVISHLRLGNVESSLVKNGSAHFLLSLDENECYRNLPFLSWGAGLYVNADAIHFPNEDVKDFLEKKQIVYHAVPAATMATDLGTPLSSNLALLGFFTAFGEGPVSYQEMRETIETISPDRFKEKNLKVFDAGFNRGMGEKNA